MKFLNTKHLIFVLLGVSIVSLKTYPTIFIILGGRDTWIATIIASAIIFLIMDYWLAICKANNCYNLYQIYKIAVGKIAGTFFIACLFLTFFLNMLESTSLGADTVQEHFLPYIPTWLFIAATVACATYVVKRTGKAVVTTVIITIIMICISGITLAILTQKYKIWDHLLPIMGEGVTAKFIYCIVKLVGSYGCVFLIFPYLEHIEDKSKLIRHTNYGMLVMSEIQIFCMLGTLTTFDATRLHALIYPKLTQAQMISYFSFLEAGELFVMLQVIAGWFIKYILSFSALLLLANTLRIQFKGIVYVVAALSFVCSALAASNLFQLTDLINILVYIQLVNYILIPIGIFTLFWYRYEPKSQLPQKNPA